MYRNCDHGVSRSVTTVEPDAVIEWRMDVLNAGYGDMFWQSPRALDDREGLKGHMIFKDVRMVGHTTGELWNDMGIRAFGGWKSVLIDGCTVVRRNGCVQVVSTQDEHSDRVGQVTIRDVTVRGPDITGVRVGGYEKIGGLTIDDVNVYATRERPSFPYGIGVEETGEGGGLFTIRDVRVDGHLEEPFEIRTGPQTTLETSNLHARLATFPPLPEGVDVGLMPREGFGFGLAGTHADRPPVPGTFQFPTGRVERPGISFTPVVGDPKLDATGRCQIAYFARHLRLWFRIKKDRQLTRADGPDPTGATRLRIGLAQGRPGEAKQWYEIDVAPTKRKIGPWNESYDHPKYAPATRVRRFAGDEPADIALKAEVGRHNVVWQYLIQIPWKAVGIDPSNGRIRLDLGYIDVKNGQREGVWALGGKTSLIGAGGTKHYKRAALLRQDELKQLKLYFEEMQQNRQQGVSQGQ